MAAASGKMFAKNWSGVSLKKQLISRIARREMFASALLFSVFIGGPTTAMAAKGVLANAQDWRAD